LIILFMSTFGEKLIRKGLAPFASALGAPPLPTGNIIVHRTNVLYKYDK
jgi:hypothetical protein